MGVSLMAACGTAEQNNKDGQSITPAKADAFWEQVDSVAAILMDSTKTADEICPVLERISDTMFSIVSTYDSFEFVMEVRGLGRYWTPMLMQDEREIPLSCWEKMLMAPYQWTTINSDSVLIGTTPNTAYSAPAGTTYKVGDMYLNYYNWNIYECVTAGVGTAAVFYYKGNIKGAQGAQGPQGPTGPAGADGGIVSKAYRFQNTRDTSYLHIGDSSYYCTINAADARIIKTSFNGKQYYYDIHLTFYITQTNIIYWLIDMNRLGNYGNTSSMVFELVDDSCFTHGANLVQMNPVDTDPKFVWYGTMTIRHASDGLEKGEQNRMLVLDIHGARKLRENCEWNAGTPTDNLNDDDFESLFTDGMTFDLTLE